MADYDYDLFVIGGGSGGVRAARVSSQMGARVALAEESRFGGTCVIRGCVPKKLMVYASSFRHAFEDAAGYGWSVGETSFDWTRFRAARDAELDRLENIYLTNLGKAGVETFRERATLDGPNAVMMGGRRVTAKTILIATGGRPTLPRIEGASLGIVSDDAFHLPEFPDRMVIIGGGYVAVEFACIFAGLGCKVTLANRSPTVLRHFDHDLQEALIEEMRKGGIEMLLGTVPETIVDAGHGVRRIAFDNGEVREAEVLFFAAGRRPYVAGLGLESAGIELGEGGQIPVDAFSRTTAPSVYAIGDVTDRLALTPVAIREGMAFAETVFNDNPTQPDHALIPTAIFSQPEIGTVGLSEQVARESHDVVIYRTRFRAMAHAFADRDERMLMKLIVDRADRRVLGCHIMGHGAGEMIQCLGIAIKMGATKEDFDRTMAVHPTAAEELVTMRDPVE